MKRWLVPLCLLIGQLPLPGQGTAAGVQKGEAALAEGLVEIAELHFRQALADPTQPPAEAEPVVPVVAGPPAPAPAPPQPAPSETTAPAPSDTAAESGRGNSDSAPGRNKPPKP